MSLSKEELASVDQRCIDVVFGFIRRMQQNMNLTMPIEISNICLAFYLKYIKYDGQFNVKYAAKDVKIINPRKLDLQQSVASARLDKPLPLFRKMSNIIKWEIVFYDGNDHEHDTNMYEFKRAELGNHCFFVGVVSEKYDNFQTVAFNNIDAFGISGAGYQTVFKGKTNYEKDKSLKQLCFRYQDVFKVQYDSFKSTISFSVNDEQYCIMQIPSDRMWYPAVSWLRQARFVELL
eukprot:421915_1